MKSYNDRAHILLFVLSFDGKITRLNALILVLCLICYTVYAIVKGRRETKEVTDEYLKRPSDESKNRVNCPDD